MNRLFAALSVALSLAIAVPAQAVSQFGTGASLVAPFDATDDRTTFLVLSSPECVSPDVSACSAHLSFWAENPVEGEEELCPHAVNFSTCITTKDTMVIDVTNMRSQDGSQTDVGPVRTVAGLRGVVVVTAYETDEACNPATLDEGTVATGIAGTFTIADFNSSSAVGGDMVTLPKAEDGNYVDLENSQLDRINTSSMNPNHLDASGTYSVVISLAEEVGPPAFPGEIGPNQGVFTASTTFFDNMEIPSSLPDLRTSCVEFIDDNEVIPPTIQVESSGSVELSNINVDGLPVGVDTDVWVFRAKALGPFGASHYGRQLRGDFLVPTPESTSSPAPGPTATPVPTATPKPTATPVPTSEPTPEPTATPAPTAEPTLEPTPEPTPDPTPTSELVNGPCGDGILNIGEVCDGDESVFGDVDTFCTSPGTIANFEQTCANHEQGICSCCRSLLRT